jgi:hypothetical protein
VPSLGGKRRWKMTKEVLTKARLLEILAASRKQREEAAAREVDVCGGLTFKRAELLARDPSVMTEEERRLIQHSPRATRLLEHFRHLSQNDKPVPVSGTVERSPRLSVGAAAGETPVATILAKLDMRNVRDLYLRREWAHETLRQLFTAGAVHDFVQLALGISNPAGNFSAAEHGLGPRVLLESSEDDVFKLATEIEKCSNTRDLPDLIYQHRLPYLKISVGSEIAMMLKPNVHWVGNVRTIWSHLLIKHNGKRKRANKELSLYRDEDRDSEMDYRIWRDIYRDLERNILEVGCLAAEVATNKGVRPGPLRFMWADAVASELFEQFAEHS